MSWRVESWDPAYGAGADEPDGPRQSRIDPLLDVESPPARWRPIDPGPARGAPVEVLFVDGVRRIDALGWSDAPSADGAPPMGLFGSYAAGVVRCRPAAAVLVAAEVRRGVFSAVGGPDLVTVAGRYVAHRVPARSDGTPVAQQLGQDMQDRMRALEAEVSALAGAGLVTGGLLVVDGPLHDTLHTARTLGYAKTHATRYLPPELNRLVGGLRPGQRTPVFGLGRRYSWYLKLPGGDGGPWAGVVRVECRSGPAGAAGADDVAQVLELASTSQVELVRYASVPYKDPRAPQNLYPIAGLERELRRRLGDQRILHRAIRGGAARPA